MSELGSCARDERRWLDVLRVTASNANSNEQVTVGLARLARGWLERLDRIRQRAGKASVSSGDLLGRFGDDRERLDGRHALHLSAPLGGADGINAIVATSSAARSGFSRSITAPASAGFMRLSSEAASFKSIF